MKIDVQPPPPTERSDAVDELHGDRIADPYRWLEDDASERTRDWTAAQNERTRAVLDAIPQRARFASRLHDLLSAGLLETPRAVGGRMFHGRREGDQRQQILYVRDGIDGADRVLVDPNALDPSGLTTLDWWYASPDGRYVAYGLSRGGDERSTLYVRDIASGKDLPERIPHTRHATVAWVPDGFYYTRGPEPGTVPPGDEHYYRHARYHHIGTDPNDDPLIFGEGRAKEDMIGVSGAPGGRWIVISAWHGWTRNDVYLLDRESDRVVPVIEDADGITYAAADDETLWLLTNVGSPNYRVARADPRSPREWTVVVPEGEHVIESFAPARAHVAVSTLELATSRLAIWSRDGVRVRDVELPGIGTVAGKTGTDDGLYGDRAGGTITYSFQSFTQPAIAFAVAPPSGASREVVRLRTPAGLDADEIVTERTSYRSRDGTEVSLFLVHRRDIAPDGQVPTVLYGYGGFNVARTPMYSAGVAAWVEAGGLYALANLRGGSERGEAWHRAGMREHKQNVFDDFHAAAEALIATGWTDPQRLGAYGGSNGGLLVGAALTQRPDLFGAVVCAVPLLDMLRYQNFLVARYWIPEYGSAEDPDEYRWLRAYSPYHALRRGTRYPPVLFTTATGDSRVDPMHARKMAAKMQDGQHDASLVLLRVDSDAGHGIGKPLNMQVDDLADIWSFFAWQLGLS